MSLFRKATKTQSRARVALVGPSGSGKTWTALTIAQELGARVAVIDTERGSASKYADHFAFDVAELDSYEPDRFRQTIYEAGAAGYDVIVIDSLSHAWSGTGGALEQVDKAAARSKSKNSFAAWREVTPQHNAMVEAIMGSPAHVIVTMRSKTAYEIQEDTRGRKAPVKIGLAPVQRDGVEYEFDIVCDIDHEHQLVVTKSRCHALADAVIRKPGPELGQQISEWLSDGEAPRPHNAPDVPTFQKGPHKGQLVSDERVSAQYLAKTLEALNKQRSSKPDAERLAVAIEREIQRRLTSEGDAVADKLRAHVDATPQIDESAEDEGDAWGLAPPPENLGEQQRAEAGE